MLDIDNKSNWKCVLSHLKKYMGAYTLEVDNSLSDREFRKKLEKTIEDASNQYSSLTGARYKGPDFNRIFQEDTMRLQRTEELIEKMLIARPLTYELNVFEKWGSNNKINILLRAQSARSTPLFEKNQNVFHLMAKRSGMYWLEAWCKNRTCMSDQVAIHWLNQLSDDGHTPLQLFWLETIEVLNFRKTSKAIVNSDEFDNIAWVTTLVLENDWSVLDPQAPKSIARQWEYVKSNADFNGVFSAIDALITKKNLNSAIKDIKMDSHCPPAARKI